jgi:hypothetical protein
MLSHGIFANAYLAMAVPSKKNGSLTNKTYGAILRPWTPDDDDSDDALALELLAVQYSIGARRLDVRIRNDSARLFKSGLADRKRKGDLDDDLKLRYARIVERTSTHFRNSSYYYIRRYGWRTALFSSEPLGNRFQLLTTCVGVVGLNVVAGNIL